MRILIDYRAALKERTGVGEYTHQLVRALVGQSVAEGRHEICLFSASWSDRLDGTQLAELGTGRRYDRRIPVRVLNYLWHRWEWPTVETLLGGRFDVAHSLHPLLMPAARAAQVITIHDLDFLDHPERTRAEIRRDYPTLAPSHARRAHRILVPSRYTATRVERQLGVSGDRVVVCSPGAPPWKPSPLTSPATGYILFMGTLEPRKNVGGLLDAYARLLARGAQVPRLVLAGKPPAEGDPLLERLQREPFAGHVDRLGYVPASDREQVYRGAALLVLPSFDEGFGLPVLEAMTLGVPVVASRRGALPEVLGDAGLLVDPDDVGALADAIEAMCGDPQRAREAHARGIQRAGTFSWDTSARAALDAYRHAAAMRDAGTTT